MSKKSNRDDALTLQEIMDRLNDIPGEMAGHVYRIAARLSDLEFELGLLRQIANDPEVDPAVFIRAVRAWLLEKPKRAKKATAR